MTISGSTAQLEHMMQRLGELATVPARAARRVSSRLEELMEEEFDRGADPYEESWAPLAPATIAKGRSAPPLTDTGAMRSTLRVRPLSGAGVSVTIDHPAGVHQVGTEIMPARPILPARGELPDGWIDVLEQESSRAFKGVTRR